MTVRARRVLRRRLGRAMPSVPSMTSLPTRTRFENELLDLGLTPGIRAEIGGYWSTLDERGTVRIILIDPSGVFRNRTALREAFAAKLRKKFTDLDPKIEGWYAFECVVQYQEGEPSKAAKKAFGKLDFPVYLLASQHTERTIKRLMQEHAIPKLVFRKDIYKDAEFGWKSKDVRGVGIPSGTGFRKVAFIKTHKVFDDAGSNPETAFGNVIGHEVGHLGNRIVHSDSGLMKYPVRLDIDIFFSPEDKGAFLGNLVRLAAMN